MGSCFSSSAAANSPASYAQAAATAALHAVSDIVSPGAPAPTSPDVKQVIPRARVTRMPDGDTFTCSYDDPTTGASTTARVRIMAIDCPETRQNYGREAGDYGRSLLDGQTVTLHVHDTDRYGRIVADVVTESGTNFGEAMLAAGAAWHYKAYDKREHLAQLERDAREHRRGLWAYPRPQPPWDYRRRIREAN